MQILWDYTVFTQEEDQKEQKRQRHSSKLPAIKENSSTLYAKRGGTDSVSYLAEYFSGKGVSGFWFLILGLLLYGTLNNHYRNSDFEKFQAVSIKRGASHHFNKWENSCDSSLASHCFFCSMTFKYIWVT